MTPSGSDNPGPINIYRATAQDLKIKTLLYGHPGAGKTTLCLTANDHPALAPALLLNFEGGLLSVVGRGDVDAYDVTSIDDLERMFWYLHQKSANVDRYNTIIVDSGSELYNKALREAVDNNILRNQKRADDPDNIQLEDYGRAGHTVFRLFSMFRDLPKHVIVTSHAKEIYPQGTQVTNTSQPVEVRPSFSTSLATRLEGIFDNVHYIWVQDVANDPQDPSKGTSTHRYLMTRRMGAYHAKTRGPNFAAAMGDVVTDPTLPWLYDLLIQTEGTPSPVQPPVDQLPPVPEHPQDEYEQAIAKSYVDELHRNGETLQPAAEPQAYVEVDPLDINMAPHFEAQTRREMQERGMTEQEITQAFATAPV